MFETVRYAGDKEKLKKIMEENREAYSKIDSETKDMLEIVANVKIPEKFKTMEEGEERYDMCKAFEDMRLEGYEAGMTEGMSEGIVKGMSEGIAGGIEKLIKAARNFGVSKLSACEQLIQQYELNEEEANKKIEQYWSD